MNLAEFLLARIAEDEADARALQAAYERDEVQPRARLINFGALVIPGRVLAECEAKRRIVAEIEEHRDYTYKDDWDSRQTAKFLDDLLRILAQHYADHPDFRPEWRSQIDLQTDG